MGWDGETLTTQYSYYLHGDFGTQMAKSMQDAASAKSSVKPEALIVSENTFPGAGAHGIAHVFPKQNLTENTLKYSAAQILNFHMFGVPYASPNICGYDWEGKLSVADEELCVRSFQLAFVSPLAIFNTNGPFLQDMSSAT